MDTLDNLVIESLDDDNLIESKPDIEPEPTPIEPVSLADLNDLLSSAKTPDYTLTLTRDEEKALAAQATSVPSATTQHDQLDKDRYYNRTISVAELTDAVHTSLPQVGDIPFHMWDSLAYDLALGVLPVEQVCEGYGYPVASVELLKQNEYFSKLLDEKVEEVSAMGGNATFTTKFRIIANMGTKEFIRRLHSEDTSSREFHALYRLAVELAELVPQPNQQQQQVAGAGVTINLHGIPGLEHIATTITHTPPPKPIIDVEATPVANDIDELEAL